MIIFRVENNTGKGFYSDGFFGKFKPVEEWLPILKKCPWHDLDYFLNIYHPRLPTDIIDMVYDNNSTWVCGFATQQAMHDWFPDDILKDVPKFGGRIVHYEVSQEFVKEFDKQCVFDISKAKFITI